MVVYGGGEGGGAEYLRNLLKTIDGQRFQCIYLSLGRDTLAEELRNEVHAIETLEGREASLFGAALGVRKAAKKHRVDVIHTHGLRANFAGRIAGKLASIPVVTTVHSAIGKDYSEQAKGLLATKIDNATIPFTDRFIAVSESIKDDLVQRGAPKDKISVVYNGVSAPNSGLQRNVLREKIGVGQEDFVLGTVARLEPIKGISHLIEAAAELKANVPNLRVIIIGSGSEKEKLEEQIDSLNLSDAVRLLGYRSDARDLISSFDVFAVPSLAEGFGLVAVEGMAGRVPVVASNVGGIPEILRNEENGLLVSAGDGHALAEAILTLYRSPELRERLAEKAFSEYRERFTIERFASETESVLEATGRRRVPAMALN